MISESFQSFSWHMCSTIWKCFTIRTRTSFSEFLKFFNNNVFFLTEYHINSKKMFKNVQKSFLCLCVVVKRKKNFISVNWILLVQFLLDVCLSYRGRSEIKSWKEELISFFFFFFFLFTRVITHYLSHAECNENALYFSSYLKSKKTWFFKDFLDLCVCVVLWPL